MFDFIRGFFYSSQKAEPQPLRIDGVGEAPLTPEPDDAELAAQALMELMMANHGDWLADTKRKAKDSHGDRLLRSQTQVPVPMTAPHDAKYYHQLAAKIRAARESSRLRTLRFIVYCEQQLRLPHLPATGKGSLQLLETELLKRIDIIEREGGELKKRWQHCLAEVTVRLMDAFHTGGTDDKD
jgi:hypothetical protein